MGINDHFVFAHGSILSVIAVLGACAAFSRIVLYRCHVYFCSAILDGKRRAMEGPGAGTDLSDRPDVADVKKGD